MPRDKDKEAKLVRQKTKQAVDLALAAKWREAIEVNKSILEIAPDDVDAYNRLGRAYLETGEYDKAREAYQRALELDPYNTIAQKNLRRLANLSEVAGKIQNQWRLEPASFIEETSRAAVVNLYHLGPASGRIKLVAGDPVELRIQDNKLAVFSMAGDYLGLVEPRYTQRPVRLMKGGNRYAAVVASSSDEAISVVIRLVHQDPSLVGIPSFPPPLGGGVYESPDSGLEDEFEESYTLEEGEEPGEEEGEEEESVEEDVEDETDEEDI